MKNTQNITTLKLVIVALLVSLYVVLSRFLSISTWGNKIGFSFVLLVVGGMILGPVYAGIIGAMGDFIGAILFPIGAYFPGYTATAFLMGWIYGMVLHKEQYKKNIIIGVIGAEFLCSLLLNTLWISITYGSPFEALLLTRISQFLIMSVVKIVTIIVLVPYLKRLSSLLSGVEKSL